MNKYNNVDCCYDCKKQFNDDLCTGGVYCRDTKYCGSKDGCKPGACPEFEKKEGEIMNNKTLDIQNIRR